jgi:hypothetical protein
LSDHLGPRRRPGRRICSGRTSCIDMKRANIVSHQSHPDHAVELARSAFDRDSRTDIPEKLLLLDAPREAVSLGGVGIGFVLPNSSKESKPKFPEPKFPDILTAYVLMGCN